MLHTYKHTNSPIHAAVSCICSCANTLEIYSNIRDRLNSNNLDSCMVNSTSLRGQQKQLYCINSWLSILFVNYSCKGSSSNFVTIFVLELVVPQCMISSIHGYRVVYLFPVLFVLHAWVFCFFFGSGFLALSNC